MSSRFDDYDDETTIDLDDLDYLQEQALEEQEKVAQAWQLLVEVAPFITDPELLSRINSFLASVEG